MQLVDSKIVELMKLKKEENIKGVEEGEGIDLGGSSFLNLNKIHSYWIKKYKIKEKMIQEIIL